MMNTLFVAWQQPDSREWIPVARLERRDGMYRFAYTRGVFRAKGFQPFNGMQQSDAVFESSSLFPLFSNRLISKSRPEFPDYMRWLSLSDMTEDPMAILALTGGIRGTDSIELFQPPVVDEGGTYSVDFFVRSLSHLPRTAVERVSTMAEGERLFLLQDCQNDFDPFALALRTDTPACLVGYCPKYYVQDLGTLLDAPESNLEVRVKSVNLDAPLNMRLHCTVRAKVPDGFTSLSTTVDFQPVTGGVPVEWQRLSTTWDDDPSPKQSYWRP